MGMSEVKPGQASVGGRNGPGLCLSTPEGGLANLWASYAAWKAMLGFL